MARNSVEDTKAVAVLRVFLRTHPHGHDIEAVYERLTQRNKDSAEKREFETSEEYRRRLATISARPVIGSLIIEDLFAFEVPLSDPVHPSSLTYDADVGVMRAGIHFEQMLFSEGPSGAGPGTGAIGCFPQRTAW